MSPSKLPDIDEPLTDYELALLRKLLSQPGSFPPEFKTWVKDSTARAGQVIDAASIVDATGLGGMAFIEKKTLSASASSVTFSNIPQKYSHLKVIGVQDNDAGARGIGVQFNGDTGNNYTWIEQGYTLSGPARTDGSTAGTSSIRVGVSYAPGGAGSPGFSPVDAIILDYLSAAYKRTLSNFGAFEGNTNYNVRQTAGFWGSTAAITSLTLIVVGGGNFISGSKFSLYGLV